MASRAESPAAAGAAFASWPSAVDDVLDAVPCGLILFGTDLGIVRRNRLARRIFAEGLTADAVLPHRGPDSQTADWVEMLKTALQSGRPVHCPAVAHTAPDGSP